VDLFDYVPQETGGSFVLNEKCKRFLDAIPGSPRIVLIAGATRSGKSSLLNMILMNTAFQSTPSVVACTRGLMAYYDSSEEILYLDTQGLFDGDIDDMKMVALSAMLSDLFIYNVPESINTKNISRLSEGLSLCKELSAPDNLDSPTLLWVERNASLRLVTSDANLYLAENLRPKVGALANTKSGIEYNSVRQVVTDFFPNRFCERMVRPVSDDEVLGAAFKLEEAAANAATNDIRPEFRANLQRVSSFVKSTSRDKIKLAHWRAHGGSIFDYFEHISSAVNSKRLPHGGIFAQLERSTIEKAEKDYGALYKTRIEKIALPVKVADLKGYYIACLAEIDKVVTAKYPSLRDPKASLASFAKSKDSCFADLVLKNKRIATEHSDEVVAAVNKKLLENDYSVLRKYINENTSLRDAKSSFLNEHISAEMWNKTSNSSVWIDEASKTLGLYPNAESIGTFDSYWVKICGLIEKERKKQEEEKRARQVEAERIEKLRQLEIQKEKDAEADRIRIKKEVEAAAERKRLYDAQIYAQQQAVEAAARQRAYEAEQSRLRIEAARMEAARQAEDARRREQERQDRLRREEEQRQAEERRRYEQRQRELEEEREEERRIEAERRKPKKQLQYVMTPWGLMVADGNGQLVGHPGFFGGGFGGGGYY